RDGWWQLYGDAELDALQQRLLANSPDLAAALARYRQAEAVTRQSESALLPRLNGSATVQRLQQSQMRPLRPPPAPNAADQYNSNTLGVSADYEVDLWGRISNQVTSSQSTQQAVANDLASARLSLAAQLADGYLALRGLDRESAFLQQSVESYVKALELTQTRHQGGIASGLDVARAQTLLDNARSQLAQSRAQRALVEHAIAALVGESASSFSIAPRLTEVRVPPVPVELPSTLLQRRPDIAAAQRRVAAANANVGVVRAGYYPAIMLGASAGYQSSDASDWIKAPNLFWSVGPSLVVNLFDAGKRRAEEAQSRALLDEAGAKYRGVVLTAFQQVEDNLALLNHYQSAREAEQSAVAAAQRSVQLAQSRYREGVANYLEVVTAQVAALQSERNALNLAVRQQRASVQLIRALGGGWSESEAPSP
ncbi:MAG TPA: efflux transporter outer membrane subunit, partial [Pseudomonadales bacterium]|nr:efflux transporter outer membrane subunit [Pseudomonadales bacterium]